MSKLPTKYTQKGYNQAVRKLYIEHYNLTLGQVANGDRPWKDWVDTCTEQDIYSESKAVLFSRENNISPEHKGRFIANLLGIGFLGYSPFKWKKLSQGFYETKTIKIGDDWFEHYNRTDLFEFMAKILTLNIPLLFNLEPSYIAKRMKSSSSEKDLIILHRVTRLKYYSELALMLISKLPSDDPTAQALLWVWLETFLDASCFDETNKNLWVNSHDNLSQEIGRTVNMNSHLDIDQRKVVHNRVIEFLTDEHFLIDAKRMLFHCYLDAIRVGDQSLRLDGSDEDLFLKRYIYRQEKNMHAVALSYVREKLAGPYDMRYLCEKFGEKQVRGIILDSLKEICLVPGTDRVKSLNSFSMQHNVRELISLLRRSDTEKELLLAVRGQLREYEDSWATRDEIKDERVIARKTALAGLA